MVFSFTSLLESEAFLFLWYKKGHRCHIVWELHNSTTWRSFIREAFWGTSSLRSPSQNGQHSGPHLSHATKQYSSQSIQRFCKSTASLQTKRTLFVGVLFLSMQDASTFTTSCPLRWTIVLIRREILEWQWLIQRSYCWRNPAFLICLDKSALRLGI